MNPKEDIDVGGQGDHHVYLHSFELRRQIEFDFPRQVYSVITFKFPAHLGLTKVLSSLKAGRIGIFGVWIWSSCIICTLSRLSGLALMHIMVGSLVQAIWCCRSKM